jgi:hypothetical protein
MNDFFIEVAKGFVRLIDGILLGFYLGAIAFSAFYVFTALNGVLR